MEALLTIVKDIGPFAAVLLVIVFLLYDRSKGETKTETANAQIALDATEQNFKRTDQIAEVYKQIGDIRQELGRSQGQVIILQDNLKTSELKREAEALLMKDKIFVLQEKTDRQAATIARHEGRIAELETESMRKDALIAAKENEIIELKIDNAKLRVMIETGEESIKTLNRKLELMTRVQSLDDTIQLAEAELDALEDKPAPVPAPDLVEVPKPELPKPVTDEPKKDVA